MIHRAAIIILCIAAIVIADDPTPSPSTMPTASPSPTPEPVVLAEGQLVDYVGAGVRDAKVTLRDAKSDAELGGTRTDHLGDFRITATAPVRGKAVLIFEKAGYQTLKADVELGGDEGPPFVDREMPGAIILAGEVRDAVKDVAVAEARITVDLASRKWEGKSGADGKFRIEGLPPARARLRVDANGFARHLELIEDLGAAGEQHVDLEPERIVHLEIAGEDGKPIGQVNIECLDDVARDYRHLLTQDDGKVAIRGLAFKSRGLELRLSHPDFVSDLGFDRVLELPAGSAESTHKLVMQRAAALTGAVLDAATKKPLAGARLVVGEAVDGRQPKAFTDAEGAYRLEGVPPGEAVVTVHLADHAPQLEVVRLAAGQEVRLEVLMSPARVVRGTVSGPEGKKLGGAYVQATRWRDRETIGLRAIADDSGEFEIPDAPQDEFEVAVYLAGYKPLRSQKIVAGREQFEFALEVDPRGGGEGGEGPAWKIGEEAPALEVTTLEGKSWKLADFRGKVVLVDFWATWCGPCVGEIPNLAGVFERYKANPNFVMASVSLDEAEATVRSFAKARGMAWTHAAGPKSGAREAADAYRVVGIPAIFVIDAKGKIAALDLRGAQIAKAVGEALGAAGGK